MPGSPPGDDEDPWPAPHDDRRSGPGITSYRLREVERQVSNMRGDLSATRASSGENLHSLKRLEEKVDNLWKAIDKLERSIPNKAEFYLMRLLVFGMAGSALLAVLSMILLSAGIKKP